MVGFASAGIHANGFSLVRRIVGDDPFDADLLLPPTVCYLDEVRALRARADVRALAHVTGGGIAGNLARVLPAGVGAVIDPAAWERPPVFGWLARRASPRTSCAACSTRHRLLRRRPAGRRPRGRPASSAGSRRASTGVEWSGRVIGVLVSGEGTNLQALIDAGLPIAAVASNRAGVRRSSEPRMAGIPTAVFDADALCEPRGARRGARALAPRARRRARRPRRLHAPAPAAVLRGLRPPRRQHALGAAARVPGAPPDRGRRSPRVSPRRPRRSTGSTRGRHRAGDPRTSPSPVEPGDTPRRLRARVQAVEHRLLPEVVQGLIAA